MVRLLIMSNVCSGLQILGLWRYLLQAEHCSYNRLGGGERCGLDRLWKLPLEKLHIWEVATWENTLGKLPLGIDPMGKYLTSLILPRLLQSKNQSGIASAFSKEKGIRTTKTLSSCINNSLKEQNFNQFSILRVA